MFFAGRLTGWRAGIGARRATRPATLQRGPGREPPKGGRLWGNPYMFLGRRPFREAHLRGYIFAQHRAGRRLSSIVDDPYVRRLGSETFVWQVIEDARTIAALERDVREAIERCAPPC
jgi:hypothetical protein